MHAGSSDRRNMAQTGRGPIGHRYRQGLYAGSATHYTISKWDIIVKKMWLCVNECNVWI